MRSTKMSVLPEDKIIACVTDTLNFFINQCSLDISLLSLFKLDEKNKALYVELILNELKPYFDRSKRGIDLPRALYQQLLEYLNKTIMAFIDKNLLIGGRKTNLSVMQDKLLVYAEQLGAKLLISRKNTLVSFVKPIDAQKAWDDFKEFTTDHRHLAYLRLFTFSTVSLAFMYVIGMLFENMHWEDKFEVADKGIRLGAMVFGLNQTISSALENMYLLIGETTQEFTEYMDTYKKGHKDYFDNVSKYIKQMISNFLTSSNSGVGSSRGESKLELVAPTKPSVDPGEVKRLQRQVDKERLDTLIKEILSQSDKLRALLTQEAKLRDKLDRLKHKSESKEEDVGSIIVAVCRETCRTLHSKLAELDEQFENGAPIEDLLYQARQLNKMIQDQISALTTHNFTLERNIGEMKKTLEKAKTKALLAASAGSTPVSRSESKTSASTHAATDQSGGAGTKKLETKPVSSTDTTTLSAPKKETKKHRKGSAATVAELLTNKQLVILEPKGGKLQATVSVPAKRGKPLIDLPPDTASHPFKAALALAEIKLFQDDLQKATENSLASSSSSPSPRAP